MSSARRYMVRVPLVDTSFAEWWAAQDNPSASVMALIRDQVARYGFTDSANRPIAPLSRADQDSRPTSG